MLCKSTIKKINASHSYEDLVGLQSEKFLSSFCLQAARHLPTGMFEVVTAGAWDECEGIVMVTIVLVGACVWDTDPEMREEREFFNSDLSTHITDSQTLRRSSGVKLRDSSPAPSLWPTLGKEKAAHHTGLILPCQEEQGCWLTGCGCWRNGVGCQNRCYRGCGHWCASAEDRFLWGKPHHSHQQGPTHWAQSERSLTGCWQVSAAVTPCWSSPQSTGWFSASRLTWAMVWSCCFGVPNAGWDGSVILVVTSRAWAGRWILIAADGGCWIDKVGRLKSQKRHWFIACLWTQCRPFTTLN